MREGGIHLQMKANPTGFFSGAFRMGGNAPHLGVGLMEGILSRWGAGGNSA